MENTDIFNAATAPLTFHDFLDRMRHPAAADLVRSIKSFIVAFLASPVDADEDSRSVQDFLTKTEEAIRANPLWAGATDEETESAGEGLEKYLMTKLFPRAFSPSPEDSAIDEQLSEKISRLQQFIRPEHLDIPANFQNESSWLLAQKELQKINTYKAPRDKLVCILNCCRVINNILLNVTMASNDNPPGADDFLPVLIFVVIGANPPQLHSNLLYIQRYRHQSRLVSEAAYFYTNLASAEAFLRNLDATSLSMDPAEFDTQMQAGEGAGTRQWSPTKVVDRSKSGGGALATATATQVVEVEQELSVRQEDEVEAKRLPSPLITRGASETLGANPHRGPSVAELLERGAAGVVEADEKGQLQPDYRYLYAKWSDLTVADVQPLLQDYKHLVWKYTALTSAVNAARHRDSLATQTDSDTDQQQQQQQSPPT